jgi:hypothetical protein
MIILGAFKKKKSLILQKGKRKHSEACKITELVCCSLSNITISTRMLRCCVGLTCWNPVQQFKSNY